MNGYLDHLVTRALDAAPVLKPRLPSWFESLTPSVATLQEVDEEHVVADASPAPPSLASPLSQESREIAVSSQQPEISPRPGKSSETVAQALQKPIAPAAMPPVRVEREIHEKHEVVIERRVEEKSATMPLPPGSLPRRVEPREPAALEKNARNQGRMASPVQTSPVLAPVLRPVSASVVPIRQVTTLAALARPVLPQQRENQPPPVAALIPKPVSLPAALPLPRPESVTGRSREPLPPTAEEPVIRVSIGRVDVRAVFAPPPAAAPRRRCAAPMLSLDDYLKQKDGRVA
jgi:hypothetical protein